MEERREERGESGGAGLSLALVCESARNGPVDGQGGFGGLRARDMDGHTSLGGFRNDISSTWQDSQSSVHTGAPAFARI